MKLIWQKTGDYIDCDPIDHNFVEYWLNLQKSFVWNTTSVLPQQELLDELSNLVDRVHTKLSKLKIKLIDTPADYTSQSTLNILHRNWVQLHLKYPNFLSLFDNEFKIDIARINKTLHELEISWTLGLQSDNNFLLRPRVLPNFFGQSNIKIPYENLGRSSYNKWLNFDESLETSDTNNFKEIYNKLSVNLNRSFISDFPKDYVSWINTKGFTATPNELLLANFANLDTKQDTYRTLFMKNFVLELNDVIFAQ
jgi:hypothetical protein